MKKWMVRVGGGLIGLALLLSLGIWLAAAVATGPGDEVTPSGHRRNEALYHAMRDGVRIAVDVWYPSGLARMRLLEQAREPSDRDRQGRVSQCVC